jgi:hypothetical protein
LPITPTLWFICHLVLLSRFHKEHRVGDGSQPRKGPPPSPKTFLESAISPQVPTVHPYRAFPTSEAWTMPKIREVTRNKCLYCGFALKGSGVCFWFASLHLFEPQSPHLIKGANVYLIFLKGLL